MMKIAGNNVVYQIRTPNYCLIKTSLPNIRPRYIQELTYRDMNFTKLCSSSMYVYLLNFNFIFNSVINQ